ncbi:MAG: type II-A CRISPR-associated protein Csn2 [Lachnospiraceae bacterium]|nr:type II-A CRISPR-associated protein Csn2 [Lachnospiraceae bacterium]
MKLVNPRMNIFCDVKENEIQVLVIENPKIFVSAISEIKNLIDGNNGEFILSDDLSEIEWKKSVEIIIDPWLIDFNSKRIKSTMYKTLAEIANENLYLKYNSLKTELISYMEEAILSVPYGLEYNTEIEESALFKFLDLRVQISDENFITRIIEYINIIASICFVKVLFFVNIKSYLTSEELMEIYKTAKYNKIQLFLIENHVSNKIDDEIITIIDKDNCIIEY